MIKYGLISKKYLAIDTKALEKLLIGEKINKIKNI